MFLFHWVIFRFKMIIFRQKNAVCHDVSDDCWKLTGGSFCPGDSHITTLHWGYLVFVETSRYETTTQGIFLFWSEDLVGRIQDFGWRFYPRNSQHDLLGIHPPKTNMSLKKGTFLAGNTSSGHMSFQGSSFFLVTLLKAVGLRNLLHPLATKPRSVTLCPSKKNFWYSNFSDVCECKGSSWVTVFFWLDPMENQDYIRLHPTKSFEHGCSLCGKAEKSSSGFLSSEWQSQNKLK